MESVLMSVLLYGLQSLPDSVSMMYKAAPLCGLQQKRGGKMVVLHILKLEEGLESS